MAKNLLTNIALKMAPVQSSGFWNIIVAIKRAYAKDKTYLLYW